MLHSPHRAPHPTPLPSHTPPSSSSPSLPILLLSLLLLLLTPTHSTSAPLPASLPTSTPPQADVWPSESHSGSATGDTDPRVPDTTSFLRCPDLETIPSLGYNQSIVCTIECRESMWATAGKVSDYSWSAESGGDTVAEEAALRGGVVGGERSSGNTAEVRFGTVTNFLTYNESQVIAFTYTAPAAGTVGILRVMTGPWAQEIDNSPMVFTMLAPASGNDTTPIVDPPHASSSSSFVSLSNPAFLAVCAVAAVLLVAAVVGGLWARRVFARKADEVRERQDSERQWAHSVPSLKARLDVAHASSLARSTLHDPLLR